MRARLTAAAVAEKTEDNVLNASSSEGLKKSRGGAPIPASPYTFSTLIYFLFIMYLFNMGRVILLTLAVMSMLLCQVRTQSFSFLNNDPSPPSSALLPPSHLQLTRTMCRLSV